MQQETEIPTMKLQSMVYQLMRLCEKLEAHGDRGIQRDLELKETIENLNETINELNQVGPVLEENVKKITQITVNNFLGKIRDHLEQHISNACYKLIQEANRVEKIVNANESLVLSNFLLYMGGAILAGILIGIFITFKYLR